MTFAIFLYVRYMRIM